MEQHLSDSKTQRDIEQQVIEDLSVKNPGWQRIDLLDIPGCRELANQIKPDAVWKDNSGTIIVAECYMRIGKLKPGHRRKIATDILKLISLKDEIGTDNSLCLLLVVPEELGYQLEEDDWLSIVIRREIKLVKVSLSDVQRENLRIAVKRQGEGQSRKKRGGSTV